MLDRHHNKIEVFLIHLVAVLFTLSTISAVYLASGISQTNQTNNFNSTRVAFAAYAAWVQTNWDGGTSSDTYAVSWNTTGGWNKYSSGSGVTAGGSGFTLDAGGNIVSSVFDTQGKRINNFAADNSSGLTYSARGASSVSEVASATWLTSGFCNLSAYRYIQYKIENTSGSPVAVNYVYLTPIGYAIYGTVSDASSGNPLSGVTITYDGGTTTTASLNLPKADSSLIKQVLAAGNPPPGYYVFTIDFIASRQVSITAAKSGYNSQTKSTTSPGNSCSLTDDNIDFSLTKASNSTSGDNSSSSTYTGPPVSTAVFQTTTLPSVFTAAGATTTSLAKVTDPKNVTNFTLDIPGESKIVFTDKLDLSGQLTVNALKELDKHLNMGAPGVVDLDSKALVALNKRATITMYGLKFTSTPEVLVNGKKDTSGLVGSIHYAKNTLTFNVKHFTKYSAAPKLEIISPTGNTVSDQNTTIQGRISDPLAVVTGTFNGTTLAKITPDKKTGQFTISGLAFKEGENILKLSATSKLGNVLPLTAKFTYSAKAAATSNSNLYIALIIVLIAATGFALLLLYLIYRRRKRLSAATINTPTPTAPPVAPIPPQSPPPAPQSNFPAQ